MINSKLRAKMSHCTGCQYERYNHPGTCERPGIDAPVTSEYCWHLPDAKLATLYFYVSTSSNFKTKKRTLSCYHTQAGYGSKTK